MQDVTLAVDFLLHDKCCSFHAPEGVFHRGCPGCTLDLEGGHELQAVARADAGGGGRGRERGGGRESRGEIRTSGRLMPTLAGIEKDGGR